MVDDRPYGGRSQRPMVETATKAPSAPVATPGAPAKRLGLLPLSLLALLVGVVTGLGALIGVAAAGFVRGLHWLEDGFDLMPGRYLRHAVGMLLVGVLMYVLWTTKGHYYVEGVGYSSIQAI